MKDREHRKEFLTNLRNTKPEEMEKKESDLREELFWLRFKAQQGAGAGHNSKIWKTRRDLARVLTVESERRRATPKEAK